MTEYKILETSLHTPDSHTEVVAAFSASHPGTARNTFKALCNAAGPRMFYEFIESKDGVLVETIGTYRS